LARGCLATAIEVAKDPELRRRAAAEFEARTLANTSKPTYDSQLKAISRIAEAANFELLPITREKVAIIGGALKAANYKSANLYLVRYKRAHVEAGYAINDELLFVLRSAKRAAQRGTGATKKAAVFDVELVAQVEDCVDPVVTGGPLHPRRFVVMGTWWLLREIEASLIRINQVSLKADGVTVTLDLPVSKTDPDGRGFVRAHSCPAAGWAACGSQSCPACTVRAQVAARNAEGATGDEPLFTCITGGIAKKTAAAATIRALVEASGQDPQGIDGHSMRRSGAQMLVAAGVDPQMVEWFGRWRSDAVRSYTEDVRAQAPQATRIASTVRSAAPATPGPIPGTPRPPFAASSNWPAPSTPSTWPQTCGQASNAAPVEVVCESPIASRRWVEQRLAAEDGEAAIYPLRVAANKVHIALRRTLELEPRSWAALCGWRFGLAPAGAVRRLKTAAGSCASTCANCRKAASRAQIPVDGVFNEPEDARESADYVSLAPSAESSSSSSESMA
jgi:hypothetical protein